MNSAKDLISALTASTGDIDTEECGPKQDCHDRIKIALFFDGTGNNREADAATKKWSNVARLFDAARDEPRNGIYARYISGIGTKLNGEETPPWWATYKPGLWYAYKTARDSGAIGGGTGTGAAARLESGDIEMNDILKRALKVATDKAGKETIAIFQKNEAKGFVELNKALSSHRLIKSAEISVFGFSRGSALARAFVNRLFKKCKHEGGKLTYQGIPITFKFLGIFDTVASMGRPAKNDFPHVDLWLPKELEACAHYVAAHEFRYSFPVDLIRQHGSYPGNWKETVFPGTHSDVGGGYTPTEQARVNSLGRVTLCSMFHDATLAGVRLYDWKFVSTNVDLKPKFVIPESTQKLYDAYMANVGSAGKSGTVEQRIKAHMKQYYAYKRAVTGDKESPDEKVYEAAAAAHQRRIDDLNNQIKAITTNLKRTKAQYDHAWELAEERNRTQAMLDDLRSGKEEVVGGEATIAEEAAILRAKQKNGEPLTISKIDGAGARTVAALGGVAGMAAWAKTRAFISAEAEPWMLDAYYGPAPNAHAVTFFDTLVHDSKAAFLGGAEPWTYFRKRGIWESAASTQKA